MSLCEYMFFLLWFLGIISGLYFVVIQILYGDDELFVIFLYLALSLFSFGILFFVFYEEYRNKYAQIMGIKPYWDIYYYL